MRSRSLKLRAKLSQTSPIGGNRSGAGSSSISTGSFGVVSWLLVYPERRQCGIASAGPATSSFTMEQKQWSHLLTMATASPQGHGRPHRGQILCRHPLRCSLWLFPLRCSLRLLWCCRCQQGLAAKAQFHQQPEKESSGERRSVDYAMLFSLAQKT